MKIFELQLKIKALKQKVLHQIDVTKGRLIFYLSTQAASDCICIVEAINEKVKFQRPKSQS